MDLIETFYAERKDAIQRDLLARYAFAWSPKPVQKLARKLVGLDLLAAVDVAQELTANTEQKGGHP